MTSTSQIDYETVYTWFKGTIWEKLNCGVHICGNARCCHSHPTDSGENSYIFFLPGEEEYLRNKLGAKFPYTVQVDEADHFHCPNSSVCVYDYRSIDCRSYPLWPLVREQQLVGFIDYRSTRCPIATLPESFIHTLESNWAKLFSEYEFLADWFQKQEEPSGRYIVF